MGDDEGIRLGGLFLFVIFLLLVGGCVNLAWADSRAYNEAVADLVGNDTSSVRISEAKYSREELELLTIKKVGNATVTERLAVYDKRTNRIYYVDYAEISTR